MDQAPHALPTVVAHCPACARPLAVPAPSTCQSCGLALRSTTARRLFDIDRRMAALTRERDALLSQRRLPASPDGDGPVGAPEPGTPRDTGHVATGPVRRWLAGVGPQTLLAISGVVLLAVAALVFTAVAWTDLPIVARAGLLLGAAAGTGLTTRRLVRSGLVRTAEATAVLTVVLLAVLIAGIWRAGVLDGIADGATVFMVSAALLAAVSHLLAGATGTRSPLVLTAGLAPAAVQSAGPWVADHVLMPGVPGLAALTVQAGLLGAATIAGAYAGYALTGLPIWRRVVRVTAAALWVIAAVGVPLVLAHLAPSIAEERIAFALGLVLSVATVGVAQRASRLSPRWDRVGVAGMWFAGTGALTGALWGRVAGWPDLPSVLAIAVGSGAVWLIGSQRPRTAAAVGMLPLLLRGIVPVVRTTGWLADVLAQRVAAPWPLVGTDSLDSSLTAATTVSAAVLVGAVAVVATAAGRARVTWMVLVGGGGVIGVSVATMLWPAGGGAAVGVSIVAVAAVVVARAAAVSAPTPAAFVVAVATVVAATLSLSTPALTITTLALAAIATVIAVATIDTPPIIEADAAAVGPRAIVAAAVRTPRQRVVAALTAIAVADVTALTVAVVAATTDGTGPIGVGMAVAAACGWFAAALLRTSPTRALAIEVTSAVTFVVAIPLTGSAAAAGWQTTALAILTIAAAGVAVTRGDRRALRWVAAAAASATSATVLTDAGVEVVEAYTAPPALLVIGLAVAGLRERPLASSWPVLGSGLGLLVAPTVVQLVDETDDLWRLVAVVALGSLLAGYGRAARLQSPLVVGVGALTVAAATQIDVVTDVVPRWMVLATAGALLLWMSVRYERHRSRLSAARRTLEAMR